MGRRLGGSCRAFVVALLATAGDRGSGPGTRRSSLTFANGARRLSTQLLGEGTAGALASTPSLLQPSEAASGPHEMQSSEPDVHGAAIPVEVSRTDSPPADFAAERALSPQRSGKRDRHSDDESTGAKWQRLGARPRSMSDSFGERATPPLPEAPARTWDPAPSSRIVRVPTPFEWAGGRRTPPVPGTVDVMAPPPRPGEKIKISAPRATLLGGGDGMRVTPPALEGQPRGDGAESPWHFRPIPSEGGQESEGQVQPSAEPADPMPTLRGQQTRPLLGARRHSDRGVVDSQAEIEKEGRALEAFMYCEAFVLNFENAVVRREPVLDRIADICSSGAEWSEWWCDNVDRKLARSTAKLGAELTGKACRTFLARCRHAWEGLASTNVCDDFLGSRRLDAGSPKERYLGNYPATPDFFLPRRA
mmetsp:Transcript_62095/g.173406  ORF Transcript_62095/g.173406 Transcript_62095/m.173406 type:complete len:420 (-) Transcript_62095:173-1432(-)